MRVGMGQSMWEWGIEEWEPTETGSRRGLDSELAWLNRVLLISPQLVGRDLHVVRDPRFWVWSLAL